jgi:PII-like signaling protein
MQNVYLKFYVTEKQHHKGIQLHDWVLEQAKELGIPGGSAFRAIAGYGRHGRMHEETFFELAGELPVQVEFVLSSEKADALLNALRAPNLNLFYVRYPVESGTV